MLHGPLHAFYNLSVGNLKLSLHRVIPAGRLVFYNVASRGAPRDKVLVTKTVTSKRGRRSESFLVVGPAPRAAAIVSPAMAAAAATLADLPPDVALEVVRHALVDVGHVVSARATCNVMRAAINMWLDDASTIALIQLFGSSCKSWLSYDVVELYHNGLAGMHVSAWQRFATLVGLVGMAVGVSLVPMETSAAVKIFTVTVLHPNPPNTELYMHSLQLCASNCRGSAIWLHRDWEAPWANTVSHRLRVALVAFDAIGRMSTLDLITARQEWDWYTGEQIRGSGYMWRLVEDEFHLLLECVGACRDAPNEGEDGDDDDETSVLDKLWALFV